MFIHESERACVACNFHVIVETDRILRVTGSHVQYKSGNTSEIVEDIDIVTAVPATTVIGSAYGISNWMNSYDLERPPKL